MAKPTDQDALIQDAKSLTQDVKSSDQSLEDILAEYGAPSARRAIPKKQKKSPPAQGKEVVSATEKVIPFPAQKEPPKEPSALHRHKELEDDPLAQLFPKHHSPSKKEPTDPLSHLFPQEEPVESTSQEGDDGDEGMFSNLLQSIDRRAERMFEEEDNTDPQEVRRLESLIPGTDYEDEEEEDEPSFWARLRWEAPPPPDIPPRQLAGQYHKGLFSLRLRGILVLILALVSLLPTLFPLFTLSLPQAITQDPRYLLWGYAGLLGAGILLSIDLLLVGLGRGFQLKIGADTLLALCCAVNMADCLYLSYHISDTRTTPYVPITLMALWALLHGKFHKRMAQHLSCRSAAAAKTPYLVTLDEKKWNAMDTYCKWSSPPVGFGSQIQMDDGAQKFYSKVTPLLLLACLAISLPYFGQWDQLLWTASATLTAACAFGAPLCYGRSAHKLEQRLSQSGATLAGWSGAKESKKGSRVLLTDTDLFPAGSISMKQPRYFDGHTDAKIIAYTASLLAATHSGLSPLFANYLRSYGGLPRKVEGALFHEGGGVSGRVWHDDVLVGSAPFMNLMGVALQPGLHVNKTVFCAVNGALAGMFPLSYVLPDSVGPAVYTLLGEDITPVLATRDFNLIPATLSGQFHLPADYMDFPTVERRRELSDENSPHSDTITAVLTREGLLPFSEAVVAAKRLRISTRWASLICFLSSVLGIGLTAYLTSVQAYASASMTNLLIYLLMWLAPVWFLTAWSHRF